VKAQLRHFGETRLLSNQQNHGSDANITCLKLLKLNEYNNFPFQIVNQSSPKQHGN